MSFTHEDFLQLPTDILNTLSFGISLQDPNRLVIFENQKMKQWFGPHTGKRCYERWNYLGQFQECPDCPGNISRIDGEKHFIVRKTKDRDGNALTIKITHFPVTTIAGELLHYVEIIEPIEQDKVELLSHISTDVWIDKTYFAIVSVDQLQNTSAYITEPIPFLNMKSTGLYYFKLAMLWNNIVSRESGWQTGLYGPLPLLDSTDYYCYTFVFKTEEEHNLLIIMVNREFNLFEEKLKEIEEMLEKETDDIFGSEAFNNLRNQLRTLFLKPINSNLDTP